MTKMHIYEQEINDGLSDIIKANASVSINCPVYKIDKANKETPIESLKALAGYIGEDRNYDIYFINSILASVGKNKNDDVFLPEEIWAARNTPIFKQVNYMHNEKDIIGTIVDSVVLDSAGNIITDETRLAEIKDIATKAVLWIKWEDPELQDRVLTTISQIENNEIYVSMECLFKEFDYMLTKGGVKNIIKRTKDTAFLTKYLRIVGGCGEYNGSKIDRVLRNFTFSGKALVFDPANERSIIDDNIQLSKSENIMTVQTDDLAAKLADVEAKLAKAEAELDNHKKSEAAAEIASLKSANEILIKQVAELEALAKEMKEDMEKKDKEACAMEDEMKEECSKKIAEAEAKVAEANAKLAEFEIAKVTAERKIKLVSAKVAEDKAEQICKTWASSTDAQFDEIVKLYSKNSQSDDTNKSVAGNKDFDLSNVDGAVINPNGDNTVTDTAKQKALAEKIASKFNFSKKNKKN